MSINDVIQLSLPCKAEYVTVVRLTLLGVANRIGFDIDTIEDMKVSVSEVCNRMINIGTISSFKIEFKVSEKELEIIFYSEDLKQCIFANDETGIAVAIIKALMDEVILCGESKELLSMKKSLKE